MRYASVFDGKNAVSLQRDILVMGDKNERLVVFLIGQTKKADDICAVCAVQVSGWFVGQHQRGVADKSPADRDALLLAA